MKRGPKSPGLSLAKGENPGAFNKRGKWRVRQEQKAPFDAESIKGGVCAADGGIWRSRAKQKGEKSPGILWLKDTRKPGQRASHAPLNTCFKGGMSPMVTGGIEKRGEQNQHFVFHEEGPKAPFDAESIKGGFCAADGGDCGGRQTGNSL